MKIIDTHTHIADEFDPMWRLEPFTGDDLIRHMNGPFYYEGKPVRVDKALCMQSIGLTGAVPIKDNPIATDLDRQHKHVIESVKKYPDRLMGIFVWNPWQGIEESAKYLRKGVEEGLFKAIKLHPMRHQFFPDAATELTHPIMEEAAKLKIPIICHSGDFTFAEPSRIEPIIQAFPDVTVVLSHFGSQWVVFDADMYGVLKRNENAYAEIGWGPLHFLRLCVTAGLKDKLVLGTDSPPNDEGMWIRAVEVLGYDPPLGVRLSAEDRENILWKTAARIFKVDL